MEQPRDRRQRAVRLTEDALHALLSKIDEGRGTQKSGRASYGWIAGRMDLSTATVRRILAREGNDLATLIHAFSCFGIEWKESYVERPNDPPVLVKEETFARRPTWLWRGLALAMLAAVITIVVFANRYQSDPGPLHLLTDGYDAYGKGDYTKAALLAEELVEWGKHNHRSDRMMDGLRLTGDVRAAQGRLSEAIEAYRSVLPMIGEDGSRLHHLRATTYESLGNVQARLGDLDAAETSLQAALDVSTRLQGSDVAAGVMRSLGSIEAVRREVAVARRWYDAAAISLRSRSKEDLFFVDLDALRALLLSQEGKTAESLHQLNICLHKWENVGHKRWTASTLLQIGSVHADAGNNSEARKAILRAKEMYLQTGDSFSADICEKWLRSETSQEARQAIWYELYF